MKYPDATLQIFCKTPIAGEVKTRLIPELGDVRAAELSSEMIERLVGELNEAELSRLEIWFTPDESSTYFDRYDVDEIKPQRGRDLGERMANALEDGLDSSRHAVLMGTDCPPIDASYVELALQALKSHDVVLGPAEDGGYGLVGVSGSVPAMFGLDTWGTDRVLADTCDKLNRLKVHYKLLPLIWDVDRPEDLPRYRAWLDQS